MNIVLAADDNYALPCMVTISSILSNNNPAKCSIYVLTLGFDQKNTDLFLQLQQNFNAQINIVVVNPDEIRHSITSDRFPISNFFRLLIPQIFDFDKALYLDCDIIVNGNIEDLWEADLKDMACGVIIDQACDDITLHNRILTYTTYYNAGVLLMNLDYWRKENVSKQVVDFMRLYPERCLYPDQDAINALLVGKLLPLDCKFNFQERWYEPQNEWLVHREKWGAIENAKRNPVILHYTGPQKPWMPGCSHPLAKLYFKYKSFVIKEDVSVEDDIIRTRQKQAERAEEIARKKRHKHIRRANLFMILFIIETIAVICYLFLSR